MQITHKFTLNNVDEKQRNICYDEVNECPMCKSSISPVFVSASYDRERNASVTSFCRHCFRTFITRYSGSINTVGTFVASVAECSEPLYFEEKSFDENISLLSPQFVKIYNQALSAENSQLDEIAGLGYRKALEFLIKDFAISKHPEDEEGIKLAPLSKCINTYIDSENIKILATRSVWLGNDEAHYLRKHEDRDISDMKKFINACVYFIGMILLTDDAASIDSK